MACDGSHVLESKIINLLSIKECSDFTFEEDSAIEFSNYNSGGLLTSQKLSVSCEKSGAHIKATINWDLEELADEYQCAIGYGYSKALAITAASLQRHIFLVQSDIETSHTSKH